MLDEWFARRSQRDVSIKMNTGTGKTAVGLIALRSSLNEGVSPALYVAPDRFLVRQAADQAGYLGIPCTEEPDSTAYASGDAIGIVTVHKLVNGRSVFGGPGSNRVQPVEIGAVVIDDAHACVRTIEDQSTVRIPKGYPEYIELLSMFEEDLRGQSMAQFTDVQTGRIGTTIRVPISAWGEQIPAVIQLLEEYEDFDEDKPWQFSWSLIRDILPACQAVFSSQAFEIQPLCPPTNRITSLEVAPRRL
ncbi:MAG: DEAD/DEAH box helicase, partial [Gammaproteobacteria bacterium]|nr:DEAD/DEAH box helicase [Gammaproteobacteria bacterium]